MKTIHDTLRDNKNKYIPAAAALMALGATACSAETPGANRDGQVNPNITSIKIDEGANVRETPVRADADADNLVTKLNFPLNIETPDGIATFEDNNGTWFEVPAEIVSEVTVDADEKEAILKDEDGMLWINDDSVTPLYEQK